MGLDPFSWALIGGAAMAGAAASAGRSRGGSMTPPVLTNPLLDTNPEQLKADASAAEKKKLLARRAKAGTTVLTQPLGLSQPANVQRKTLLGTGG